MDDGHDSRSDEILQRARVDLRLIGAFLVIHAIGNAVLAFSGVEDWSLQRDIDWPKLVGWTIKQMLYLYGGIGLLRGGPAGRIAATFVLGTTSFSLLRLHLAMGAWVGVGTYIIPSLVLIWVIWSRRTRPLFVSRGNETARYPDGSIPKAHKWVRFVVIYMVVNAAWTSSVLALSRIGVITLPTGGGQL
jgi:hypothetical protein